MCVAIFSSLRVLQAGFVLYKANNLIWWNGFVDNIYLSMYLWRKLSSRILSLFYFFHYSFQLQYCFQDIITILYEGIPPSVLPISKERLQISDNYFLKIYWLTSFWCYICCDKLGVSGNIKYFFFVFCYILLVRYILYSLSFEKTINCLSKLHILDNCTKRKRGYKSQNEIKYQYLSKIAEILI